MRKIRPWSEGVCSRTHKESSVGVRSRTWSTCWCSVISQQTKPSALCNVLEEALHVLGTVGVCLPSHSCISGQSRGSLRVPLAAGKKMILGLSWIHPYRWTVFICRSQESPRSMSTQGAPTHAVVKRGPGVLCVPGRPLRYLSTQHTEPHHCLSWRPQE